MNRREMLRRLAIGASGLVLAESVRDFMAWEAKRIFALGGVPVPRDPWSGRWISATLSGWSNGVPFRREIGPEYIVDLGNGLVEVRDVMKHIPDYYNLAAGTYTYTLDFSCADTPVNCLVDVL